MRRTAECAQHGRLVCVFKTAAPPRMDCLRELERRIDALKPLPDVIVPRPGREERTHTREEVQYAMRVLREARILEALKTARHLPAWVCEVRTERRDHWRIWVELAGYVQVYHLEYVNRAYRVQHNQSNMTLDEAADFMWRDAESRRPKYVESILTQTIARHCPPQFSPHRVSVDELSSILWKVQLCIWESHFYYFFLKCSDDSKPFVVGVYSKRLADECGLDSLVQRGSGMNTLDEASQFMWNRVINDPRD
jgi:hypothetical protein